MPIIHCFYQFQVFCKDVSKFYEQIELIYHSLAIQTYLTSETCLRPSKKTNQAKAQHHSSTHFVQQRSLIEADEEHDSTYESLQVLAMPQGHRTTSRSSVVPFLVTGYASLASKHCFSYDVSNSCDENPTFQFFKILASKD